MKKVLLIAIIIVCISNISVLGQEVGDNSTVSIVDTSVDPAGYLEQFDLPPVPTEGNVYLEDNWQSGNITLKGGYRLNDLQIRYDLFHNSLEFMDEGNRKVCPLYLIEKFNIAQNNEVSVYVNIKETPLVKLINHKGIVKVIYTKKISLFSYTYLKILEPTYAPEFDMGRKSDKIVKKKTYYLINENKPYKLYTSINKNEVPFGNHFIEIKSYIKKNNLKLKQEKDLIEIVDYYNQLTSK